MGPRTANAASELVDHHQKMANAAAMLAKIFDEFPDLFAELARKVLDTSEDDGLRFGLIRRTDQSDRERNVRSTKKSNSEKVIAVFLKNGNKAVATPQIGALAGLNYSEVANVLWSASGERRFERQPHPTNKKTKLWRLRADEYSRLLNDEQKS